MSLGIPLKSTSCLRGHWRRVGKGVCWGDRCATHGITRSYPEGLRCFNRSTEWKPCYSVNDNVMSRIFIHTGPQFTWKFLSLFGRSTEAKKTQLLYQLQFCYMICNTVRVRYRCRVRVRVSGWLVEQFVELVEHASTARATSWERSAEKGRIVHPSPAL